MSATKAGIYVVTFRAFDACTNGIGGGPIHTPSNLIRVYFEAGVNIALIEPDVRSHPYPLRLSGRVQLAGRRD